ncbi:MAG: lysophospholipid acyltransferase family protein [Opitutales bacterium]|nr:lysophospholipid acyltransferase family protein [Opitutales bacterium]MCH8539601.1 lysophospholipid acyltransferase family protein [Opitutales bacterium]
MKKLSQFLTYGLARMFLTSLKWLPITWTLFLGERIGLICYRLMPNRRKIVRRNLRIAKEHLSEPMDALERQTREVFLRSGANLLTGFCFSRLPWHKVEKYISIKGISLLNEKVKKGQGVIVLMAHMGPWEALAHLPEIFRKKGISCELAAMFRPLNNKPLNRWVKKEREASGTRMFSRDDGFSLPLKHLRNGGMLGILADQKMKQGPKVDFFGQPAFTNPLPGLFQRRTGAALVSLSFTRTGKQQWLLEFHHVEPLSKDSTPSREAMCQATNRALEKAISESLTDEFWFQRRF